MKKKIAILVLLLLVAIGVICLLVGDISSSSSDKEQEITLELPPPVIQELPNDKLQAYASVKKQGSYRDYYQSLPSMELTDSSATPSPSTDNITEKKKENNKTTPVPSARAVNSNTTSSPDRQTKGIEPSSPAPRNTGFITAVSSSSDANNETSSPATRQIRVCVVRETTITNSGEPLTVRLLEPLHIKGHQLPVNTHVVTTAITGDRLLLQLPSIRWNGQIIPVEATLYDMDGKEGINIHKPTRNITQDVSRDVSSSIISAVTARVSSIAASAIQSIGSTQPSEKYTIPGGYELILKIKL